MTTLTTTLATTPLIARARHLVRAPQSFVDTYTPLVKRDFKIAARNARNQLYRLVVTPKHVLVRENHHSSIRIDLSCDCQETIWLKQLYRNLAPAGVSIRFDYELKIKANCVDHLEDVWMLVVVVDYN